VLTRETAAKVSTLRGMGGRTPFLSQLSMTIIQSSPGKHLNSRPIQRRMSCPGGTFRKFTKSYLRTLSLFYKEMPEVKVSDTEMVVKFNHTSKTYTLV
jgi:hypothetical protein